MFLDVADLFSCRRCRTPGKYEHVELLTWLELRKAVKKPEQPLETERLSD